VVVTSHDGKGPHSKERYRSQILPRVAVLEVPTPLAVTHVQPLPGGKVLIGCARTRERTTPRYVIATVTSSMPG
jgi:hypothetical protein